MEKRFTIFLLLCFLLLLKAEAQVSLLQSGPMVGYSDFREVKLWVQTRKPARVKVVYRDKQQPDKKFETAEVNTRSSNGHTAHLLAEGLEPGRRYSYELYINGRKAARPYPLEFQTQELWQWRKDAPDFSFALGSCTYVNEEPYDRPGNPYGSDYQIFGSIAAKKPDFMLWLGDNIYLREVDWNTRSGIYHRYTHTRSLPEMQPLLGSVHHYALWDDHDYGPNDADRSFWMKDVALEAFHDFWANPNYGTGGGNSGTFFWNDVQFFLLDNRFFRSPNEGKTDRQVLGKEQIQWLLDALTFSKATFKFIAIGGQVLNPAQVYENYSNYEEERAALLKAIEEAHIPGVIFLNGDRHHTELSKLDRSGTYPLYDLTVSPLTAGTHAPRDEGNTLLVPGTLVNEHNFAIMQVTGPKKERQLTITVFSKTGQQLWQRIIKAAELK